MDSPRPPIHIVHSDPSQIPQQFPAPPTSISGPVGRLTVSALIPRSVTLGFPMVPHGQWKRVPHAERTYCCLFKRVKTTQANGPSGLSTCSTVSGTTSYSRILPLLARPWVALANPMPISIGMPAFVPDRSVTGLVLPLVCLVCWVWCVWRHGWADWLPWLPGLPPETRGVSDWNCPSTVDSVAAPATVVG